jgi:hypothetical protein
MKIYKIAIALITIFISGCAYMDFKSINTNIRLANQYYYVDADYINARIEANAAIMKDIDGQNETRDMYYIRGMSALQGCKNNCSKKIVSYALENLAYAAEFGIPDNKLIKTIVDLYYQPNQFISSETKKSLSHACYILLKNNSSLEKEYVTKCLKRLSSYMSTDKHRKIANCLIDNMLADDIYNKDLWGIRKNAYVPDRTAKSKKDRISDKKVLKSRRTQSRHAYNTLEVVPDIEGVVKNRQAVVMRGEREVSLEQGVIPAGKNTIPVSFSISSLVMPTNIRRETGRLTYNKRRITLASIKPKDEVIYATPGHIYFIFGKSVGDRSWDTTVDAVIVRDLFSTNNKKECFL